MRISFQSILGEPNEFKWTDLQTYENFRGWKFLEKYFHKHEVVKQEDAEDGPQTYSFTANDGSEITISISRP